MSVLLNFFEQYDKDGHKDRPHCDWRWNIVFICYTQNKISVNWVVPTSVTLQVKMFKQMLSAHKMATVFWEYHSVILYDFVPQGETINANTYCETLKKLWHTIHNYPSVDIWQMEFFRCMTKLIHMLQDTNENSCWVQMGDFLASTV